MFCNNCGFENTNESLYCGKCGKALTNESPDSGGTAVAQAKNRGMQPGSNFILAVVSLFFCTPFGVVSLVYSNRSEIEWNMNHDAESRAYSDKARNWAICSIILGVIIYIISFLWAIVQAAF